MILNPDSRLSGQTIENFFLAAKKNPDFAMIGPSTVNYKSNQKSFSKTDLRPAESIKGYAMFLNLSEFKDVGFFDENFFFFLEEVDLCSRLLKKNKKVYYCPSIPIYHEGGHSHESSFNYEMELSRNWHWMWSTFIFHKKYKGFYVSFLIILPKLISAIIKVLIYTLIFNKKKKIYYQRLSGLINAIMGKSSWYRPKV